MNKLLCSMLFVVIGGCIFLLPSSGYSFDDHYTHKDLSKEAIEKSQLKVYLVNELNFWDIYEKLKINHDETPEDKEGKYIKSWIQDGSYQEDNPACRASNHFHNPLLPWKQSFLTDEMIKAELGCLFSSYEEKNSNIVWATGYESRSVKKNPPVNNDPQKNDGRNWDVAREYFYQALQNSSPEKREEYLAQAFKTIGQSIVYKLWVTS